MSNSIHGIVKRALSSGQKKFRVTIECVDDSSALELAYDSEMDMRRAIVEVAAAVSKSGWSRCLEVAKASMIPGKE